MLVFGPQMLVFGPRLLVFGPRLLEFGPRLLEFGPRVQIQAGVTTGRARDMVWMGLHKGPLCVN